MLYSRSKQLACWPNGQGNGLGIGLGPENAILFFLSCLKSVVNIFVFVGSVGSYE